MTKGSYRHNGTRLEELRALAATMRPVQSWSHFSAQERSGFWRLGRLSSDLLTPTGIASGSISMLDALLEIDFCLSCELN